MDLISKDKGKRRISGSPTALGLVLALAVMSLPFSAHANPDGGVVVGGQATIQNSANRVDIHQSTNRAVIDWREFNIAPDETTQFHQPSAQAIALNRVKNSKAPSRIDGTLKANGNVVIVNQNGVVFGQGASVDVNGLVATSADIDNDRFMNDDRPHFNKAGSPDAIIENEGQITAREAGLVGFVAPQVENSGVIQARMGRVQLSSGETTTVDFYGDGLLEIGIGQTEHTQVVKNTGTLKADGGVVAMTAQTGAKVLGAAIEQRGVVQAQTVQQKNGRIVIAGLGRNAVKGNVASDKSNTDVAETSVTLAGTSDVSGKNADEKAGSIEVLGDHITLTETAKIDARGAAGGGNVKVGGDYLGLGDTPVAKTLDIKHGSEIDASATTQGHGGRVIAFADGLTIFDGIIRANGAGVMGDGGFVETSGKSVLWVDKGFAEARGSMGGAAGEWLLDPADITIDNTNPTANVSASPNFQPNAAGGSFVRTTTIVPLLNAGTNVTIQTNNDAFAGNGDIFVNSAITSTGAGNLTLSAFRNIQVNSAITLTGGSLLLRSNNTGAAGGGAVQVNGALTTNGGNITIGGGSGGITTSTFNGNGSVNVAATGFAQGNSVMPTGVLINAAINAGGGNILINGRGENGTNSSPGIEQMAGGTIATSGSGTIQLNGVGQGTAANSNSTSGVILRSTVTGVNGVLQIAGNAGGGTALNFGVLISGVGGGRVRTTGSGNIIISGTGGPSTAAGGGVLVNFTGGISPTGTGSVTVFGNGGTGVIGSKYGVALGLSGGEGSIAGAGRPITITGLGGTATTADNNHGIFFNGTDSAQITNTGTGGTITMTGTGGGVGVSNNNHGIFVTGAGGRVATSGSGAITLTGNGGNLAGTGGTNHGVYVNVANGIGTSGTSNITINGTRGGQTSSFGIITDVANGIRNSGTSGNITLASDTYSLNAANNVVAPGTIAVGPRTAITMGVGSGAGVLQFDDTYISYLTAGTGYTFGNTTALSLDVNTAAANLASRAITFISNANITINSVLNNLTSLTTTAASGATNINAVIGGVTPVGNITMTGQDLFINQNMTSNNNISGVFTRDITLAASRTVQTGAGGLLRLQAANNNPIGTGNLTLNGNLSVGTGVLELTSGVNGTRPSWTANATNLIRQGATFGAVTIQGFLDTVIDRTINSSGNVSITSFRNLTVNPTHTISSGGTNALTLRAANGNPAGTGVLNLNGITSVGTGALTLVSGLNPTRVNFTATGTSLVRQGATFGALDIQGFNDFVVDRVLNSTAAVTFSNNTRTVLRNNISSSGGAVTLGNAATVDEGISAQITTTNQAINLNAPITGTAGGGVETLTVNAGTNTVTVGSGGAIDGVDLNITGGSIAFNAPIGAVTGLGATTLTSTNTLTLPNITASSLTASTTGANQALLINGSLTTTQAGGALSLSSNASILKSGAGNVTTNNGAITMNAATNLMFANNFTMNSTGGVINLTGSSGIVNAATVAVNSGGGNVNVNSPLVLAAPLSFDLGTGNLAFASTINGAAPFASVFDVLAVGGGGGGGGRDAATNGGGGGAGGVVDTRVNTTNGIYTILIGGGGGAGGSAVANTGGGTGGLNGGGTGGNAGPGGTSGGGGGGGGYSGIRIAGTYFAVGGGGAGGGGGNEGTANDVQAPGGGLQPNGNTGTMNGGNGANFVGDGGGGGGGGGGFLGGQGQTNVTTSGQGSGGSNYFNPANVSGSTINGNNGAVAPSGAGGAAVALSGARATFFNYANNAGAGGTGNTTSTNGGNGIVVIRYTGTSGQAIVQGGTVTTIGGDTLVTFTSPTGTNFFAPITSCAGSCDLTINANSVSFGGAVGGTQALDDISVTTAQSLTLPNMTAVNSILARSTGATSDLIIPVSTVVTANGAGNAVTLAAGRNFVNNGGAGAVVTPTGRYLVYSTNPANDTVGGLTNYFRRFSCDYNAPGTCAFNATVNNTVTMPATGDGFLYRITPPLITVTPAMMADVIYGNAANLTNYARIPLTAGQYLNADDFANDVITGSLNGSSTYVPGPVNGNVGTYNIDYASGSLFSALGYGFTYANNAAGFNVIPRTLTPSLIGLVSKTYDGNDTATLAGGNFSLANVFAGDTVNITNTSGTYDNKNAGVSKNVTVSGLTLGGAQASNYILSTTSISGLVGRILQRALTVSATGINKTYDGNTTASVTLSDDRVAGDVLTVGFGAASFADPNAGAAKPVTVTGITVTGTDSGNYTFNSTAATNATINKAVVTATAQDRSIVYGDTIPSGLISYSGFVTGEDETVLDTLPTVSSALSGLQNVGIYNGNYTVSGGVDNNYDFAYVAGRLIVGKRDLNVTANNQSVTYGTAVPAGTLSYSGFITGEDETDLLSLPVVASGLSGIQNVGTYTGNYTVSGGTSDNYNLVYFAGDLIVTKKDLNVTLDNKTINFGTIVPAGTFVITGFVNGDDEFDIDTLPVAASALSGVQNAGTYAGNYTASGGLDNNYSFLFTPGTLTVNPVGLNVTVNQQTVTYGDVVPATTITYTGFVNGDDEFDLVTIPSIFSGLSGIQNAGTYAGNYTASGGVSPNYIFNYIAGDLVVNKKDLNVTAQNRTITYGDVVPLSALIYSGFITGEDETDLITIPTISSALSGIQNVGVYNGNYTVSGGASNNYNFVFAPGNLIVSQRTLIVSAVPQNIQYGTAVPAGSILYSGFITGEDETDLTTLPTLASALSGIQPVGTYANNYTVSGGSSSNYNFSYVAADLVVGRKLLIISAQNQVITYGTAVPAGSILYAGFIAGEDETDLVTLPTLTSTLSGFQNAGSYIGNYTVGGAASPNYDFQYNAGNLTVNQAPLSIIANPVAMTYGAGNNFAGFTPTGLVLGETIGSVTFASSAPLSSSGNWRVGSWIITPSAATGGTFNPANYNISYITGSLNIAQRILNVAVNASDKIYDANRNAAVALSDDRVTGDVVNVGFIDTLFDTKNAGLNKTVTVNGVNITGTDAANYTVASSATAQADITPRALVVTATGVDKVFDGTTTASVLFGDNRLAGDIFTVSGAAGFADAAIGNNKPVTVTGIALSGVDAGNYLPNTTAFTTANITDGTPPPPPFVPTLPPTVEWTSQNQFGGVLFLTDDGVYATPSDGYVLVYLPREAPELNRRRNKPVTAIKSF